MNIQAEKKWIKSELDKVNDELLIRAFKNLLNFARKKNKEVAPLKPMSMKEYYAMIKESEKDIKAGQVHLHEDVVKYYKKKK